VLLVFTHKGFKRYDAFRVVNPIKTEVCIFVAWYLCGGYFPQLGACALFWGGSTLGILAAAVVLTAVNV
jgi:hypothetical protein